MINFIILSLSVLAISEAGLIPREFIYPHFPHLKTVYHGHGATSYQNVNIENYGSVPIPKDLQVDDGHEYHHYLHHHEDENVIPTHELQHFVDHHTNDDDSIISAEATYSNNHVGHLELEDHYAPASHYDNYDHQIEYEYH